MLGAPLHVKTGVGGACAWASKEGGKNISNQEMPLPNILLGVQYFIDGRYIRSAAMTTLATGVAGQNNMPRRMTPYLH